MKNIIRIITLSAAFFCAGALADEGITYQEVASGHGAFIQPGQRVLVEKRTFEWSAAAKDGRGKLLSFSPQEWVVAQANSGDEKTENGLAGMRVGGTRLVIEKIENARTGSSIHVAVQIKVIDVADKSMAKTKNGARLNDKKS